MKTMGSSLDTEQKIKTLEDFVSDNKKKIMKEVLKNRTRHVTFVLEDIFQPHNASATIRTADCLGIQDIHIIENRNAFRPHKLAMQGAGKWMNVERYNENFKKDTDQFDPEHYPVHNTELALKGLKKRGYQLIATSPGSQSITLDEINLKKPIAFLFGTEAHGLTPKALEMADETLRLPMVGFTESYNISVSVAMTLSHTMHRLWNSKVNWQLSKKEQNELKLEWFKRAIGKERAEKILKRHES
jgi:tRNA (guanosine-2'-O-)-methyltransferase